MVRRVIVFAGSILISLMAGAIGSLATVPNIQSWYKELDKPPLLPPNEIFGPVWTVLYVLMGIALALIVLNKTKTDKKRAAYMWFGVQLLLNTFWSVVFFGLHQPWIAVVIIVTLLASLVITTLKFRKLVPSTTWMFVPYIAWVCFATYLNIGVAILNPHANETQVKQDQPSARVVNTPQTIPGSNELFAAVQAKQSGNVAQLVRRGAKLDVQDTEGRTPAMVATYNNDFATAKVLIEAGADVNIRDKMLNNPFLYAGAEGYLDILKLTIKAGADPKLLNRFGGTALIPAGEHGHVEVIRELLTTTKIDVNHINTPGWTALLEAILLNNGGPRQQQAVQLLVDHGANVNIADKNGVTPLQHARAKGFSEIVRILESADAR